MKFLNRVLRNYAERDFVLQQKARVVAVICLLLLCIMPIILVHSYYLQTNVGFLNLRVLIPELVGIILFATALWILVKGYYQIAAHLLIISALAVAWTVMFVSRFSILVQMDTIVYVMAIMTMTALFIYRQKYAIPFYFVINEILLLILVVSSKERWGLSSLEMRDYIIDNTIALMFISLVAYNVIALNRRALDRAEADIERRAKVEKELQERNIDLEAANVRFAKVMDSLDSYVYVADIQTYEILYINRKVRERFGDVIGKICWKSFYPQFETPCNFCTNHLLLDSAGEPVGVKVREFLYPGTQQWYESREQAITWIDGRTVRMEIATNITQQRRTRDLMMETEKMTTVGRLAAGMAHEINNPLGIILQNAQNIKTRLSRDMPRNLETAREIGVDLDSVQDYMEARKIPVYIDGIAVAGGRASKIVTDMLQFSRKQDEKEKTPGNLNQLIDKALDMASNDYNLKKHYDFKHINIIKNLDADLPRIPCYPNEIEQVLLNLLINSAYALSEINNEGFDPRITLSTRQVEDWILLEVEDNGAGIGPDTLKHIFEPFFTTKGPQTGTGLGLAVSYFIVTGNHSGEITAESRLGEGTRFTIRLPL